MADGDLANIVPLRGRVSEAEWATRVDLAALYRLVALEGWDDMVFTHISARVPGPEHHFLINPFGVYFDEVTASSLVKVNLEGEIVMDSPYGINAAGYVIHSAIHGAREDALFVMHLHTDCGVAVRPEVGAAAPVPARHDRTAASGLPRLRGHRLQPR